MARLVLFEPPNWATLEWAAARYDATRTSQAWTHLDAALYEFVGRAELLTVLFECVEPRPSLN